MITVTKLWPKTTGCALCGVQHVIGLWLPMFEGKVIDTDGTEWAGTPVCEACFKQHQPIAPPSRPPAGRTGRGKSR